MRRTNKIILIVMIMSLLLIGIGYASVQNISLNITGTATANLTEANFKVMFSGEPSVSDANFVTAAVTDDINATINVSGLTDKGQQASAIYTIQNASTDLSADLSVATTNSNEEYFTLYSEVEKTSLIAGEATILTVTVELTKVPETESVTSTIGIQLIAMPVEPGQEGTSEGINGSSQTPQTTVADITNNNIGEYIDLGNNIIGTENTSDDWRILYKDANVVYAILADYLPNSTEYAENAGFTIDGEFNAYLEDAEREEFINNLTDDSNWNMLANGLEGAKVNAAPTGDLIMNSYNIKHGTSLEYTSIPTINKDDDLYLSHTEKFEDCSGYWLASISDKDEVGTWVIDFTGSIHCYINTLSGFALRPVVSLPLDLTCDYENGVWKID